MMNGVYKLGIIRSIMEGSQGNSANKARKGAFTSYVVQANKHSSSVEQSVVNPHSRMS
jgi:hypothetical protein